MPAPERHLHLLRLPPRLTAQGVNPLRPGVHPALQLAYPASGTGGIRHYGILGNNRRKAAIAAARAIFKRRRRAVELQPLERELKKAFITTAACSLPPPIFRRVLGVKISGSCVSHASG